VPLQRGAPWECTESVCQSKRTPVAEPTAAAAAIKGKSSGRHKGGREAPTPARCFMSPKSPRDDRGVKAEKEAMSLQKVRRQGKVRGECLRMDCQLSTYCRKNCKERVQKTEERRIEHTEVCNTHTGSFAEKRNLSAAKEEENAGKGRERLGELTARS